jgi:hypothetical protein
MNSYLAHVRIVFFLLNALRCILFVLGGNVAAHAWNATIFLLCAFQNYLYPVSFFRHILNASFLEQTVKSCVDANFINGFHGGGTYLQGNPLTGIGKEKTLGLQVRIEPTLGFPVRMGNMVPFHGLFPGQIANT